MKRVGIFLIWIVRIFFFLIAAWQVLGLLPMLSWLSNPSDVTVGMWIAVLVKVLIMLVGFVVFWGLGKVINRSNHAGTEPDDEERERRRQLTLEAQRQMREQQSQQH